MSVTAAPSIFDAYNARHLSFQEVAQGFVPPAHFSTLAQQAHTLVVGPRGSGKTTLLKMLHPLALENWNHPEGDRYRALIKFTGVFIPYDRNWKEQTESLGFGLLDEGSRQCLGRCAFTTHILHSLVESMLCRVGKPIPPPITPHRRAVLSERDEEHLAKELACTWRLTDTTATLLGLRHALMRRLSELGILASQEVLRSVEGRGERLAGIEYLHLSYLSAAQLGVEVFNDSVGESGGHWALLFDELELAPSWIRQDLFRCLRSVDQRFLFKLSVSPYCDDVRLEALGGDRASQGHDYQEVRLWYEHKEHGYSFCRDLLTRMVKDCGLPTTDPSVLFGRSFFSTDSSEWKAFGTAYRRGSSLANRFVRLAKKDHTFAEYLQRKGIDSRCLEKVAGDQRAADVRKVTAIVALRDYFRGAQAGSGAGRGQKRRSRKAEVPTVYAGGTSLFAMVEGNPRWFIGIVGRLLKNATPTSLPIGDSVQVHEVHSAANIFCAMLKTIPCPPVGGSRRGLLSLLDSIGQFFSRSAIDEPFNPEPPCSFTVDSRTDEESAKALGNALNAGAIVYVPDQDSSGVMETLRGKRFRLSYLLAPRYHFPLLLGRAISLKEILRSPREASLPEPSLFRLLDESDE